MKIYLQIYKDIAFVLLVTLVRLGNGRAMHIDLSIEISQSHLQG